jgi:hypothetical protein
LIFLSFRAGDGPDGRLNDHLVATYGKQNVYYFYDRHEFGADFFEKIARAIAQTRVVVALIGRRWIDGIFNQGDAVRFELSLALQQGKQILPVRFEIDSLPNQLPDDLQALTRREAPPLSQERWEFDMSGVIRALDELLGIRRPPPAEDFRPVLPEARWRGRRVRIFVNSPAPFAPGEVVLLKDVWARTGVARPKGWNTSYSSLVHLILTNRAIHIVHNGVEEEEIRQFRSGARETEVWILPYEDIHKLILLKKGSDGLPQIQIGYGASRKLADDLYLSSIVPREMVKRLVKQIEASAPGARSPLWFRVIDKLPNV